MNTLIGHTDCVTDLEYDSRRRLLVSTSLDGTLKIWSVSEGKHLYTIDCKISISKCHINSEAGCLHLLVLCHNSTVKYWKLGFEEDKVVVKGFIEESLRSSEESELTVSSQSIDRKIILVANSDGLLCRFIMSEAFMKVDSQTKKLQMKSAISGICPSPDSSKFQISLASGELWLVDLENNDRMMELNMTCSVENIVRMSNDILLCTVDGKKSVAVIRPDDHKLIGTIGSRAENIFVLMSHPSENVFYTADYRGSFILHTLTERGIRSKVLFVDETFQWINGTISADGTSIYSRNKFS